MTYISLVSKIINTSLLKPIDNNCDNFLSREYDIIFVCSSFGRKIKNSLFAKEFLSDQRFSNLKKIVLGNGDLFNDPNIKNITILKQQPNSIVLDYMRNSKLLILTSLFDSSPNTVYEALDSGCNIIISKNVGNYQIFNPDSVCEDIYDKDDTLKYKIRGSAFQIFVLISFYCTI